MMLFGTLMGGGGRDGRWNEWNEWTDRMDVHMFFGVVFRSEWKSLVYFFWGWISIYIYIYILYMPRTCVHGLPFSIGKGSMAALKGASKEH